MYADKMYVDSVAKCTRVSRVWPPLASLASRSLVSLVGLVSLASLVSLVSLVSNRGFGKMYVDSVAKCTCIEGLATVSLVSLA